MNLETIRDQIKDYATNFEVLSDGITKAFDVAPERVRDLAKVMMENGVDHLPLIIALETEDNKLELRYIYSVLDGGQPGKGQEEGLHQKTVARVVLPDEKTTVPSIQDLYPVAVFHEREAFDMLGIEFTPKERIRRILLPDPLPEDVHPMRKKYTHQVLGDIVRVESEKRAERLPGGTEVIKERADYAVVVGPQHPTHKEPIRFVFHIAGETVEDADVRVGFNYRGIEKAFEARTWLQNMYLGERICGICSASHQLCMGEVVEKVAKIEAPERAQLIRIIVLELERIHSHMLWYGVLAHDAGYDTLFHLTWRDREIVMDDLEIISGNRVNYSMVTPGGVRRDIPKEMGEKIAQHQKTLRKKVEEHRVFLEKETTFVKRLEDVAPLTFHDAIKYSAVGPTLRAAGVKRDARKIDPSPKAYDDMPFPIRIGDTGDVYDTMVVRIDETLDSIDIVLHALDRLKEMPEGDIAVKFPRKIPPNEAYNRVEAPRGEDMHYARSAGGTGPDRYRVRAPTLQNLPSLVKRLQGIQVADIPVAIRSIDPCIGCMERVTFVKPSGQSVEMSGTQLKKRAYEWYATGRKVV